MNSSPISDMVTAAVQNEPDAGDRWFIYGLFLIAGLFVGGAWSAYKSENKILMVAAGLIAVLAVAGGILWLLGEMT
ncbi:membrane protein [[Brevibacterium] flavum]|uniref:Membrane protein n=1 Tax=[Brevibacterium] flavum TaxID=92706 RepID=A0A0F6Z6L5_9CORY|nr:MULTISPECIES: hypothetical protein [Corynebacterium]AIK85536.1 membrane protein [Corynebacterium glutamicum]AIK88321.1 membrane protein [Corynebacterium glutamicum]AJE67779.1 membrane protein [Corynebacterium glutamicum]AKF27890.1 membrane protein [[Brevibacterium] flavum]ANE08724.1 hypothetical protein A3654_10240 [Corynebacterium glutamicum]